MIQVRMRGGKEWYRPDRDYMMVHPRLISSAIAALAQEIESKNEETRDEEIKRLCELSTELAKLVNLCRDRKLSKDELSYSLNELGNKYPFLNYKLSEKVMQISFELYRHWFMEAIPEKPDGSVDESKMVKPVEVQPAPVIEGPK